MKKVIPNKYFSPVKGFCPLCTDKRTAYTTIHFDSGYWGRVNKCERGHEWHYFNYEKKYVV
jgi:hypothetical protein